MIFRLVGHKGLGLFAAFLNVVLAAEVLPEATSTYYLVSFSFVQIMMVFAGFGVAHKLVTQSESDALRAKTLPWFVASMLTGVLVLSVHCVFFVDAPNQYSILFYMCVFLVHTNLAEWIRCATARQTGFILLNIAILVTAVSILLAKSFSFFLAFFPFTAIVLMLVLEFRGMRTDGNLVSPNFSDLMRASKVASLNQYNNIVVFLFSLIGTLPNLLLYILVYRFAVFFNWQMFFWLRFGHKLTASGISLEHREMNWKAMYLNILATVGVIILALLITLFDLQDDLGRAFNSDFLSLIVFYAVVRLAMNFIFPYELFTVYVSTLEADIKFILVALASFAIMAIAAIFASKTYQIILIVEACWLGWRLIAKHELVSKGEIR